MAEHTEDELLAMDDDAFEEAHALSVENTEPVDLEASEPVNEVVNDATEDEERADAPVPEDMGEEDEDSEETAETAEEDEVSETEETADTEEASDVVEDESHNDAEGEDGADFDFKESFSQVMSPLKVSGKDVQVKSVDDMRNLAMMGIDYSRKMRDIKPIRAVGETLTKAGIIVDGVVNEEALARLIDINNGDKDAIAQLAAEHGIDPLDMDTENVQYTPTASIVSQDTIALQDVEKELVSRGSVDSVVQVLDTLDPQSKQFFNESPANLLKLDDDIKSGVYEEIMGTVQYEKSLGRLQGMSDMDAYIQIATSQPQEEAQAPVAKPQAKRPSAAKRKAAGISKRAPAAKAKNYDYVNMTDEEFEALTPQTSLY